MTALDLVADNYFLSWEKCKRCVRWRDPECDCALGAVCVGEYDLSTFLNNVAVAGALCAAWSDGWDAGDGRCTGLFWEPGCGKEMPP